VGWGAGHRNIRSNVRAVVMVFRKICCVILVAIFSFAINGCVHYRGLHVDSPAFRFINNEAYNYNGSIDDLEISAFAGIVNKSILKIQIRLLSQRKDTLTYPVHSVSASVDSIELDLVSVYVNERAFSNRDEVEVVREKAVVITWRFLLETKELPKDAETIVDLGSIKTSSDTKHIEIGTLGIVQ